MEPESFNESAQEEAVKANNFFTRLGGVYFSPREAFTEIGLAPRLVIPIIAVFLISAFGGWYIAQKIDTAALTRAALEQAVKQGQITEEQMNQQAAMISAVSGPITALSSSFSALLLCLAIAGYGKLFSMIAGIKNSFKSLFEVSLYSILAVSVVSLVLTVIILQIKGQKNINVAAANSIVASNLGSWIASIAEADVLPKFVMRLAGAVDIFNIWRIALLSIGFSAVSKKLKTSAVAMWLSVPYFIFYAISAAVGFVFGG